MQEGPRPPGCMMAQEEILEEPVREAQIQPEEELKETDLGTELDPENLSSFAVNWWHKKENN